MFAGPFSESIVKHAQEKNLLEINLVNIRDFGIGRHKVVDDKPYGGGTGMLMKVDVIDKAIRNVREERLTNNEERVVLLDARGEKFHQKNAVHFSKLVHLIILCGHYEGVDERVRDLVDETISIGDFILTGGEIPAMLIVDSIARLIPGVLKEDATAHESFSLGDSSTLLEYPQYTTPQSFHDKNVPDVLLSGNHQKIAEWRQNKAKEITQQYRPDLQK